MSVSVFLPIRKGSIRIENKSTRPFAEFEGGLLELKLRQLIKLSGIKEVILSTNDEVAIRIAERYLNRFPALEIVKRPEELARSETNLSDLIKYAGSIVNSDHVLWTHVTSPFCDERTYQTAIQKYLELDQQEYDSLMGGQSFQNFLWDPEENKMINTKESLQWPRTQDLKPLFEINSAIFLCPRRLYIENKNRIGNLPYLFNMNKTASLDIDVEEDFKIAEAVYGSIIR